MLLLWGGFIVGVLLILVIDLTVLHKDDKVVSVRSALTWVGIFMGLALAFNVGVYYIYQNDLQGFGSRFKSHLVHSELEQLALGKKITAAQAEKLMPAPAAEYRDIETYVSLQARVADGTLKPEEAKVVKESLERSVGKSLQSPGWTASIMFFTGYLTEFALSVDNIFLIVLIFAQFRVPAEYQHRVLFWGILGALVMRAVMILAGAALMEQFHWMLYVFGAFLVFTGIKMAMAKEEGEKDFENNKVIKLVRRIMPVTPNYVGHDFTSRLEDGRKAATPLLLVLILVEVTDLIFALDSIPAILGITSDPFLVFTSNVFAILGLRSLFFAVSGLMDKFHFLKYSLAAILAFVGLKMLAEAPLVGMHISALVSLAVIVSLLAAGITASLMYAKKHPGTH